MARSRERESVLTTSAPLNRKPRGGDHLPNEAYNALLKHSIVDLLRRWLYMWTERVLFFNSILILRCSS